MRITIFSFTHNGAALAASLAKDLIQSGHLCQAFTMPKYAAEFHLQAIGKSVKDLTGPFFSSEDALIYIGACGIAVRAIAPFLQDKTCDPCVLSIDEQGRYVISLLSGHIGGGNELHIAIEKKGRGGNELAIQAASLLGAAPIISTATDLNHKFAVDVFATKNHLKISDMTLAKKISVAILDGEKTGLSGIIPQGSLPDELTLNPNELPTLGICISPFTDQKPYTETLHLIPRQTVLGIGCRKGISPEDMEAFVERILHEQHISPDSLLAIASIDLKEKEPCMIQLSRKYQIPFHTYDAHTLSQVRGQFSSSAYVKTVTGVDNVCERAALACSGADTLTLHKTIDSGKTLAIAMAPIQLYF